MPSTTRCRSRTVDFQPMNLAQMNLDGSPAAARQLPDPVTAPWRRHRWRATVSPPIRAMRAPASGAPTVTPPCRSQSTAPANIRLNFQNASLTDVLNSLSASAGFIIVQEQPVSGTINLVSQQPVTADEAVDALNSVLADKGFVGIRNGRVLKIIPREGAQQRNLPVVVGSDPQTIPLKDNLVTQILPVRYLDVGKLVDTLRPLLSANATIASNDASNAILLTDTQVNIHRIAQIISALDTNVSSISVIKVYGLHYADAKELADLLTQLSRPTRPTTATASNRAASPASGSSDAAAVEDAAATGGGGGNTQQQPESAAREAAARVVAVADETTNSVVVSAPDEYINAIGDIVSKLDTNTTELTETQIFKLLHADATEVTTQLTSLYADSTTANGATNNNNNNNNNRGQQGGRGQPQPQQAQAGASERSLLQARVIVVADPRTNSVLVNASRATMAQVALFIGRLDATDSKKQHIYVHTLAHADPTNVAYILNGMFNVSGTSNNFQQPSDTRLQTRSAQGLTSDAQSTLGGSSSSSSGGTRPSGL